MLSEHNHFIHYEMIIYNTRVGKRHMWVDVSREKGENGEIAFVFWENGFEKNCYIFWNAFNIVDFFEIQTQFLWETKENIGN